MNKEGLPKMESGCLMVRLEEYEPTEKIQECPEREENLGNTEDVFLEKGIDQQYLMLL